MFKMRCWIPNAYILDITMYKMHVSLCYYCTIRIRISKTLTGTYEGCYTCVFEMRCYRTLDIVLYRVTQKKRELFKTQQKLKKSNKKNLLTEIETLQLAF